MGIDNDTSDALVAARTTGLVSRDAVTIFARDRDDNSIVQFAFWVGDDTVNAVVIDGETGSAVARDFVGSGGAVVGTPLMSVGEITSVNDLSVQRVQVDFSQLHAVVQSMFRTYDIRLARAEVHRLLLDPDTQNLIGIPDCQFIGQINVAPLSTPAAGQEGSISVDIVSDTEELTRTNPLMMGDTAMQARASGDRLFKYVTQFSTGNIQLPWGETTIE